MRNIQDFHIETIYPESQKNSRDFGIENQAKSPGNTSADIPLKNAISNIFI